MALPTIHLQDAKRLYLAGLIALCGLATGVSSVSSPYQDVRVQCQVATIVLLVIFWRFLKGAFAEQTVHTGCLLARQGFDLVLMDMVMPVMDGIEATAAMRASADARTRQTPVLGLTANVNAGDLVRFEQAGLNGLLLKPFEVARLYQNVQTLVAHLPTTPRGQT